MIFKENLIFTVICLFIGTVAADGQEAIIKNPTHENFSYSFKKLSHDEVLSYEERDGSKHLFTLYAENKKTGLKRLIGSWDVRYGAYQFSTDRKRGVFFLSIAKINCPLFYVNGANGTVQYLMDINLTAMTSNDLRYVLYQTDQADLRRYALIDLNKGKIVKRLIWEPAGIFIAGDTRIFRSLDPAYDFRIDYINEAHGVAAVCYYSIQEDILFTTFDKTKEDWKSHLPKRKITLEELGFW
jgi:hypothetical protein